MCTKEHKAPNGFIKFDEPMNTWRVGHMFTWSPVFGNWLQHNGHLTIRPDETYTECHLREQLSKDMEIFYID